MSACPTAASGHASLLARVALATAVVLKHALLGAVPQQPVNRGGHASFLSAGDPLLPVSRSSRLCAAQRYPALVRRG